MEGEADGTRELDLEMRDGFRAGRGMGGSAAVVLSYETAMNLFSLRRDGLRGKRNSPEDRRLDDLARPILEMFVNLRDPRDVAQ